MMPRKSNSDSNRMNTPKTGGSEERPFGADTGSPCEVCGNEYDKPLEIVVNGISHYFDCFECAIHALAPHCAHCQCRIIGHGSEAGGQMFCCVHCASEKGVTTLKDRT
jgi:hypothetical protein